MFEFNKMKYKVVTHTLVALVLLQALIDPTEAAMKCYKCTGINCQRTTYTATEDCADELDSCVSVFEGTTVLAQGCFGQLAIELRNKCEIPNTNEANEAEAIDADGAVPAVNKGCHQCNENLCNNVSAEGSDCVQCDSNEDAKCASETENLQPQRCPISRAVNTYCYANIEGNHATRGCAIDLVQQRKCLSTSGCSLCSPSDIYGCNRGPKVATENSGSDSGSSDGGSDSGTGPGIGDGGSSSGGGGGGTDSGAGSGSGTGDGGSNSAGSGTGDDGSNSGGNSGGSDNEADSGAGDGESSSGGDSGGSDNEVVSGSDTGNGSSSSGGSGTGDGGSSSGESDSGAGSGSATGGGDPSSGGDGSSSDNGSSNSGSGSGNASPSKLFVTMMLMILPYFI